MADPHTLRMAELLYGWAKYFETDPSISGWPTYLEASPSFSWLSKVHGGWPNGFIVDPRTLRLTQVFHGGSKYLKVVLRQHGERLYPTQRRLEKTGEREICIFSGYTTTHQQTAKRYDRRSSFKKQLRLSESHVIKNCSIVNGDICFPFYLLFISD